MKCIELILHFSQTIEGYNHVQHKLIQILAKCHMSLLHWSECPQTSICHIKLLTLQHQSTKRAHHLLQ